MMNTEKRQAANDLLTKLIGLSHRST